MTNELTLNEDEIQTLWNWLKNEHLPHDTKIIKLMTKISVAAHKVRKDEIIEGKKSFTCEIPCLYCQDTGLRISCGEKVCSCMSPETCINPITELCFCRTGIKDEKEKSAIQSQNSIS